MTTTITPLTVRRLAGNIGAEVVDFDLVRDTTPESIEQLRRSFHEHLVLLFRNQDMTPPQHREFGANWGELQKFPEDQTVEGIPEVLQLKSELRGRNELLHSDTSFFDRPPALSILYARKLPLAGGDTMFSNMYLVYEHLSPAFREMLDGLKAVHSGAYIKKLTGRTPGGKDTATHPVVRTHPETGRKALYVNQVFTTRFEGMTEAESQPILNFLFDQCGELEFTFRHTWAPGDVLMWDNRSAQHCGIRDYHESRLMHRVTVIGDIPR